MLSSKVLEGLRSKEETRPPNYHKFTSLANLNAAANSVLQVAKGGAEKASDPAQRAIEPDVAEFIGTVLGHAIKAIRTLHSAPAEANFVENAG